MITFEDLATELKEIKGLLQSVLDERSRIVTTPLSYTPNQVDALRRIIDRDGVDAAEIYLKQQYKKEKMLRRQGSVKGKSRKANL